MIAAPPGVRLIFDNETDGFLEQLTQLHSLCLEDDFTGETLSCAHHGGFTDIREGVRRLQEADEVIGHNIMRFDLPAIRKIYPDFKLKGRPVDTMILSQLAYPDLMAWDMKLVRAQKLPSKLCGSHSLEAWGHRLGIHKGDYKDLPIHALRACEKAGLDLRLSEVGSGYICQIEGEEFSAETREELALQICRYVDWINPEPFAEWSREMQDYCEQDVSVTKALWRLLRDQDLPPQCLDLEHATADICGHMERCGWFFDTRKAERLYADLAKERIDVERKLRTAFGEWWAPVNSRWPIKLVSKTRRVKQSEFPNVTIERVSAKTGKPLKPYVGPPLCEYEEGAEYTPIKRVVFNPGSRDQIADRLIQKHGWEPIVFTDTGKPKVDEDTLENLEYPEAQLLCRYLMLNKRIGQLAEGENGWLRLVASEGFLKGGYNPLGAITRRATHSRPNIGQVPAASEKVPYGPEFRELFTVPPGFSLVGSDLKGIELRLLAHFMHRYDDGAFAEELLSGDVHWQNVINLQLVPPGTERDKADGQHTFFREKVSKTFTYATIYGAQGERLGTIYPPTAQEVERWGKDQRIAERLHKRGGVVTPMRVATIKKGTMYRNRYLNGLPALKRVMEGLEKVLDARKAKYGRHFLYALDTAELAVRSKHSALNTLLQSAGALVAKQWMIFVWDRIREEGLLPAFTTRDGTFVTVDGGPADFAISAWVHDELNIACRAGHEELVGEICKAAASATGHCFNLRLPIEADYSYGRTWRDVH